MDKIVLRLPTLCWVSCQELEGHRELGFEEQPGSSFLVSRDVDPRTFAIFTLGVHRLQTASQSAFTTDFSIRRLSLAIATTILPARSGRAAVQSQTTLFNMDDPPISRPRTPNGAMGYLNYPPEIMNQIYRGLFIDRTQILAFLCSPDPAFSTIRLKEAIDPRQLPSADTLDWQHIYDFLYYVDSRGLSAQFLRVCRRIWFEGTPVLYGNLTIAMRPISKHPDPCLFRFFNYNVGNVLANANFVYPRTQSIMGRTLSNVLN